MTNAAWKEEVDRAVAGAAAPWRVMVAWVEQHGALLCAELQDTRTGRDTRITLAEEKFATTAERRAEIVRQVMAR